jgi:hypothetical protein
LRRVMDLDLGSCLGPGCDRQNQARYAKAAPNTWLAMLLIVVSGCKGGEEEAPRIVVSPALRSAFSR